MRPFASKKMVKVLIRRLVNTVSCGQNLILAPPMVLSSFPGGFLQAH
jgi:hypothetical protein